MPKDKKIFVCSECGAMSPKWQGKCFDCGAFGSYQEQIQHSRPTQSSNSVASKVIRANDVTSNSSTYLPTGLSEVDAVLSGGLVAGQVAVLTGEPGIGKSTLLLQLVPNFEVLYVCGEESDSQVVGRAQRLGVNLDNLYIVREQEVGAIIATIESHLASNSNRIVLVIVDSIQSIYAAHNDSIPGNISQVQVCTHELINVAKKHCLAMVIVGQVTKGGSIAGPKQFEHLVDTVMHLEGDRKSDMRILRMIKNRFGATDKVGILHMTSSGLESAEEILKQLIGDRKVNSPGSTLGVMMEANRPIIVEIQALNTPAQYGSVRRVVNGLPNSRVQMILAVLQRRAGIKTGDYDIYVNLGGGLRSSDPALDLPVALAIASVILNKPLPTDAVAFGELGLMGEIKQVPMQERRKGESEQRGYNTIIAAPQYKTLRDAINQILKSQS